MGWDQKRNIAKVAVEVIPIEWEEERMLVPNDALAFDYRYLRRDKRRHGPVSAIEGRMTHRPTGIKAEINRFRSKAETIYQLHRLVSARVKHAIDHGF